MKDKNWQDEYQQMIKDCENRESKLSEWEENFIDSLYDWIADDKIWERVTRNG